MLWDVVKSCVLEGVGVLRAWGSWRYIISCHNFHIMLFSSFHSTMTVVFIWFWSFHVNLLCCYCVPLFLWFIFSQQLISELLVRSGIRVLSMLRGCSFLWSCTSENKSNIVKDLLSCSYKFSCAVWAREYWWNNCFLHIESSSKRWVDTIKFTQGVRLCRMVEELPTNMEVSP